MSLQDAFDFTYSVKVRPDEEPELYRRAVEAVSDGNGTLTHGGKLWTVGVIEAQKLLELFPKK